MITYAIAFSKIKDRYDKIRLLQFEKETVLSKSSIIDVPFSDLYKYKIKNIKVNGKEIISDNGNINRYFSENCIIILYRTDENNFIVCNSKGQVVKISAEQIIKNKYNIANGKIVENRYIATINGEYEMFEEILYKCGVVTGDNLKSLTKKEIGLTPRWFTNELLSYINKNNKLCAIYGIRRTGKTYGIYHCINVLLKNKNNKIAYITFKEDTKLTMDDLISDIKLLQKNNYNYIFIDEITFISDFYGSANILSDVYANLSKIVISGTDSFALALSELHVLFGGRMKLFNSTFMSYKEFTEVAPYGKDKTSFENYLRVGGIFEIGDDYINEHSDKDKILESYVEDSISTNIAKSIQKYIPYDRTMNIPIEVETLAKDFVKLKTAIEKIIDNQNKQFLLNILNNEYKLTNELNIINSFTNENVRQINISEIVRRFKEKLQIDETKIYSNEVLIYLKECLWKLNILKEYDYYLDDAFQKNYILSQPALRGYQIQNLIEELFNDSAFNKLSQDWKTKIIRNLYRYVKGFHAEHTIISNVLNIKDTEKIHIYQYHCSMKGGEIDMIIYDENKCAMKIFEIKHIQGNIQKSWYHYLSGEVGNVLNMAKQRISNNIIGKYVLCWENCSINDEIEAINIEEYLKNLTPTNLI